MEAGTVSRRAELLGRTVRRLLRRGTRTRISKLLAKVRPEDVALMLGGLTPGERLAIFQILVADFPDAATEVLIEIEPAERLAIFEHLTAEQTAKFLERAAVDDAVFLLDSLPAELKEKVLEIVDLEERFADVQAHLGYADETAGRIMDTEFIALAEDTAVGEAISQVRRIARDVDMISYLYVIDDNGRLVGVTPLRQLLLADPTETLGGIMNTSLIQVPTDTDQEEVAQLASRYDLLAIPVTDDDGKLVGIVTVDDILDVFKDEANEDFFKMAGTSDDELIYQDRSFKIASLRLPWILFNLGGLLIAGYITTRFERSFELAVIIGFVPVIMGMAGNIGSQTSTIAVRGLATGRLSLARASVRTFLWQQLKVGVVLGIICALVVALAAFFYNQNTEADSLQQSLILAAAIGVSLFVSVQLASLNGVLVPVVFERTGFDPAIASGPLVTTANDVLGVLIYFGMATALFHSLQI